MGRYCSAIFILLTTLSVNSYADDTYFSFFTPTTITKNEGVVIAFGCAYDSDHFTYGMKDKSAQHEAKINPICLLATMYTSTYVDDYLDCGVEMVMKFPLAAKHNRNITNQDQYYTDIIGSDTLKNILTTKNLYAAKTSSTDEKPPRLTLEIKPQQSTGVFFRFGYHLNSIDAIIFCSAGLMFTSTKFTIYGKSITNENINVNLVNHEMKETAPALSIGFIKHIGRRSSLRIQYTTQMATDSKLHDDLHIEHTVKQKNNSFAIMFSYYL